MNSCDHGMTPDLLALLMITRPFALKMEKPKTFEIQRNKLQSWRAKLYYRGHLAIYGSYK